MVMCKSYTWRLMSVTPTRRFSSSAAAAPLKSSDAIPTIVRQSLCFILQSWLFILLCLSTLVRGALIFSPVLFAYTKPFLFVVISVHLSEDAINPVRKLRKSLRKFKPCQTHVSL
jgi:hypothetical protein